MSNFQSGWLCLDMRAMELSYALSTSSQTASFEQQLVRGARNLWRNVFRLAYVKQHDVMMILSNLQSGWLCLNMRSSDLGDALGES